jgi:hypothetical protein
MHSSQMNSMELHHAILCMPSPMNLKTPSYSYLSLPKSCPKCILGKPSNIQILVIILFWQNLYHAIPKFLTPSLSLSLSYLHMPFSWMYLFSKFKVQRIGHACITIHQPLSPQIKLDHHQTRALTTSAHLPLLGRVYCSNRPSPLSFSAWMKEGGDPCKKIFQH